MSRASPSVRWTFGIAVRGLWDGGSLSQVIMFSGVLAEDAANVHAAAHAIEGRADEGVGAADAGDRVAGGATVGDDVLAAADRVAAGHHLRLLLGLGLVAAGGGEGEEGGRPEVKQGEGGTGLGGVRHGVASVGGRIAWPFPWPS